MSTGEDAGKMACRGRRDDHRNRVIMPENIVECKRYLPIITAFSLAEKKVSPAETPRLWRNNQSLFGKCDRIRPCRARIQRGLFDWELIREGRSHDAVNAPGQGTCRRLPEYWYAGRERGCCAPACLYHDSTGRDLQTAG